MSEKINIKETTDVGEIDADASARLRRNGQMTLEVFNSEDADIAEPTEDASWDSFQVEKEGSPRNRVVVVSEELAQELEAA